LSDASDAQPEIGRISQENKKSPALRAREVVFGNPPIPPVSGQIEGICKFLITRNNSHDNYGLSTTKFCASMDPCMEHPKITPRTKSFTIHLKDKYATNALMAYAVSCRKDDPELSREVHDLALRASKLQRKETRI